MSAKKRTSDDGGVAVMSAKGPRRGLRLLIGAAILVALVAGVSLTVWRHVRGHVLNASQYQVHPEHITISDAPPWIQPHADAQDPLERIKGEVLRDVNRNGPLSLLDDDLTVRLASAFAAHPWISRVDRVSKRFPSGVDVSLAYRRPAAMVELQDGSGVLPVDQQGVLLPTGDFTAELAEQYPRIADIYTAPAGPAGTRWGDAAVLGGAQVAAALAEDWRTLDFAKIVPVERKPAKSGIEYTYALITHSGTTVFWGRAPGTDVGGEVPAEEKIAQLRRYAAQNSGMLDAADGPQQIEIDQRGALLRRSRPEVTPLPAVDEP